MLVRRIIKPGANGTRKHCQDYGDKLVCVRYRYDYQKQLRHKSIEIIVDTQPWQPPSPHPAEYERPCTVVKVPAEVVGVRIGFQEKDLQQQIKGIGGQWSKTDKLWYAREALVHHIGLGDRIVKTR